jgi:hypothetical protein
MFQYASPFERFLCAAAIEKDGPLATVTIPDRRATKGREQQMMISPICASLQRIAADGPVEPGHPDGQAHTRAAI